MEAYTGDFVYRGEFLPAELVRKSFAYGIPGIAGMKARIESWTR